MFTRRSFFRGLVLALSLLVLMPGCKLKIIVADGGSVVSESGSYRCGPQQECVIDLYDILFNEEFAAVPDPGYLFLGWHDGARWLCAETTAPCRVTTSWAELHPAFMTLLASDQELYLEPHFVRGTPVEEALAVVEDSQLRTCLRDWIRGASYAEQVQDVRCIDYVATFESLAGLEQFVGIRTLMLNGFKSALDPIGSLSYLEFLRIYIHPDENVTPLGQLRLLDRLEIGVFRQEDTCRSYAERAGNVPGVGSWGLKS